jgi:hypothetical protein
MNFFKGKQPKPLDVFDLISTLKSSPVNLIDLEGCIFQNKKNFWKKSNFYLTKFSQLYIIDEIVSFKIKLTKEKHL